MPKATTKATTKAAANVVDKKPITQKVAVTKTAAKAIPTQKVVAKATPMPAPKAAVTVVAKSAGKSAGKSTASAFAPATAKAPPQSIQSAKLAPKASPTLVAKMTAVAPKISDKPIPKSTGAAPSVREPIRSVPDTKRVGGLLSEAEIIKQAKTNYMSKDQLAFFKYRLAELASQLRENAGTTTEHLRDIVIAPDPADRATQEEEHALELRARDRERKLLKKVESSLARIAEGSYGYCDETGDPIGIYRLLARPTATLTIEAQERRELKQKMYGE